MNTKRFGAVKGDRQRHLRLALLVLFVGSAALGVWFLVSPAIGPAAYFRPNPVRMTYGYNRQILLLFVPYALALFAWWRGARVPLLVLAGGAVALHLLVAFAPPPQSQDLFQYIFYGRVHAAHGINPYVVEPSTFNWDPWYGWIRWRTMPSLYGPVWTLISFWVARASGDSLAVAFAGLKLVVLALDLAVMWMIVRLAQARPDAESASGWGLLVYAWNPLILITVPLAGAVDVGIAAAFLGAMLAIRARREGVATVLLALAALVKVYAAVGILLHLVLLARRRGYRSAARHAAGALGIAAVAYAPYWAGFRTFEGMLALTRLTNRSLAGTVQRLLIPVLEWMGFDAAQDLAGALVRWVGTAILLAAVWTAIRRVWRGGDIWEPTAVVLAVYLLVTPWFVYWYVVSPLVLLAVLPVNRLTLAILTLTATGLTTARFAPSFIAQLVEATLKFGPPLLLYRLLRRRTRPPLEGPGDEHGATVPAGAVQPRVAR